MKIAIVHDWLYGGGAEKVVEELHRIYPNAPIYTSFCTDEWQAKLDNKVVTGYLQRWPFSKLRKFLPLLRQWWFAGLNLSEFDVVISSSGNGEARFALSRRPAPASLAQKRGPVHISYTHTPTHFYYRKYDSYIKNPGMKPAWLARIGLWLMVRPLRKRDRAAVSKVDYFIANSRHIADDIKTYYGRESVVIHPPVETERFAQSGKGKVVSSKGEEESGKGPQGEPEPSMVMWGRLVPYKRFDLAVEASNKLHRRLVVVGDGPEATRLRRQAGLTVQFLGRATNEELEMMAAEATAFIFPGEEDFGIAPVEALAAGIPIIAYKSGGALDYVIDGKTGVFFEEQTVDSLVDAMERFDGMQFDRQHIARYAKQNFDSEVFRRKMSEFVDGVIAKTH